MRRPTLVNGVAVPYGLEVGKLKLWVEATGPRACENVLRGGVVRPGEHEYRTWRYRVETSRITVVMAFRSEREIVVVTAWRNWAPTQTIGWDGETGR